MPDQATGWAASVDGQILIRTVMDTRTGAMVNFLILHGIMVGNGATESDIEKVMEQFGPSVDIVEIVISRRLHG